MAEALNITTSGGTQSATCSPQTAGQAGNTGGAPTNRVQPGTAASSLLNSSGGVPLGAQQLTAVSLNAGSSTSASVQKTQPIASARNINVGLFAIPAVLVVVAIILFWVANRAEKNTTYY